MSKPVKVPDEVFERLQAAAKRSSLTIQDALQLEIERPKAEARRLAAEVRLVQAKVTKRDQELARTKNERDRAAAALSSAQATTRAQQAQMGALERDKARSSRQLEKEREAAEDLETDLGAAVEGANEARRLGRAWMTATLVLVAGCVLLALWVLFFYRRPRGGTAAEPPEPPAPPPAPSPAPPALLNLRPQLYPWLRGAR